MPVWKSKKEVQDALRQARKEFADVRKKHDVGTPAYVEAQKKCVELQRVLDAW